MRFHDNRTARGLVHAAGFHADNAIFHHVCDADAVCSADLVELAHYGNRVELFAVHRNRHAILETNGHVLRLIRRLFRRHAHFEHAFEVRLIRWVFEVEPFMADMPEVVVAAVGVRFFHRYRDAPRFKVGNFFFAALDIPDSPGSDHFHFGSKSLDAELESHLIIAFACATMRNSIGSLSKRHLRKPLREQRPRRACAKQIFLLVRRACLDERPEIFLYKLFFLVQLDKLRCARCDGALSNSVEICFLTDIAADRDHLAVIVFLEPWNDHSGIESAGICKNNLLFHVFPSPLNRYVNYSRSRSWRALAAKRERQICMRKMCLSAPLRYSGRRRRRALGNMRMRSKEE